MPKITIYTGDIEIEFYGKINYSALPGVKTIVLADGSLFSKKSYKKSEFSIDIETINEESKNALLDNSDEMFYFYNGEEQIFFYIVSDISYIPYVRFPGYYSMTLQAREVWLKLMFI